MYCKDYSHLVGIKVGKLTPVELFKKKVGRFLNSRIGMPHFKCKCDCGGEIELPCNRLGHIKTCGCEKYPKGEKNGFYKHGKRNTKLFKIWYGIISRIDNPNSTRFYNYGGRGIKICDEWREFVPFYDWAMANGYREDLSIDRIDVNGNYEPANCKWSTTKEQARNTRKTRYITYRGLKKPLIEWMEMFGKDGEKLDNRIYRNWELSRVFKEFEERITEYIKNNPHQVVT